MPTPRKNGNPADLTAYFTHNRLFGPLQKQALSDLATGLEHLSLQPGENLFTPGDPGDAMYVLMNGSLQIESAEEYSAPLGTEKLEKDACIGEISLLTGETRSSRVTALEACDIARLSASAFHDFTLQHPAAVVHFIREIEPRIRRRTLRHILTSFFGYLDDQVFTELNDAFEWIHLSSGETLIEQGDQADAAYILVHGGLHAVIDKDDSQVVRKLTAPEIVGELSLLADTRRSASVMAIRDSNLVRLRRSAFENLLKNCPQITYQVARFIAQRQVDADGVFGKSRKLAKGGRQATGIAVVFLEAHEQNDAWVDSFFAELADHGEALKLSASSFDQFMGIPNASRIPLEDPRNMIFSSWVQEQEFRHSYILYRAGSSWTTWMQRCIGQADHILLVGSAEQATSPGALEQAIREAQPQAEINLVLLHSEDKQSPSGTHYWLAPRPYLSSYFHVRHGNIPDQQRLVRRLLGKSYSVVLGGGGTRGFAHVGVLHAWQEAGMPIDEICGTSMGAFVAAVYACGHDYPEMLELGNQFSSRKLIRDYTLPFTALMAGRKMESLLKEFFGEQQIEDLWIPYFSVASNLSKADVVVDDRGPLWMALRKSMSIPGVFPAVNQDQDLVVDGAVMNNLPIDIMQSRHAGGTLVAVNVTPARDRQRDYGYGTSISGWQVLWSKINPLSTTVKVPALAANLMRTLDVNGITRLRQVKPLADLFIEPDVSQFGIADYSAFRACVQAGYQAGTTAVAEWQENKPQPVRRV